jgi:hypothetical protein
MPVLRSRRKKHPDVRFGLYGSPGTRPDVTRGAIRGVLRPAHARGVSVVGVLRNKITTPG